MVNTTSGKIRFISLPYQAHYKEALTKPPLSAKDNFELFQDWHENGNEENRECIILGNIRLVNHITVKYIPLDKAFDSDDLFSIGVVGLIRAVDTYDYKKEYTFTSYASRVIKNELNMLWRKYSHWPLIMSIDEPIKINNNSEDVYLMDILPDPNTDIETDVERITLISLIESEMNCLSSRQRNVLEARFGLNGTKALKQREVAAKFGISQGYVCRIVKDSLTILKNRLINEEGFHAASKSDFTN